MALRMIVQEGDPILNKVCRPVTKFDAKLHDLLNDMGETMLDANGVGLAGPQVGYLRRVFVALDIRNEPPEDATEEEKAAWQPAILEFVNPEILETRGEVSGYEGCLSYPGQYGLVTRPEWVKVQAFDRNGQPFTLEVEGMLARCVCHENNHLDGITIMQLADEFYSPEDDDDDEE